jgi:hypothetical protein
VVLVLTLTRGGDEQATAQSNSATATALATPRAPGECQAPQDERPAPDLPPYPCRNSELEPPPGTIPTASPGERAAAVASTQNVPEGWSIYDNSIFRYTLALPPDWYANMWPEGGEFSVYNPSEMVWFETGEELPDAVAIVFEATTYEANTNFGPYPGKIWEEPGDPEEGAIRSILFAFLRDGVVFRGIANFGEADADAAMIRQILATITPY